MTVGDIFPESVKTLFKEGVWITCGQTLAAIATIAGVRFITEIAEPSLFGKFALINGIIALLQGILFQPMAQAAFRYYPDFEKINAVLDLTRHLYNVFFYRWLGGMALMVAGGLTDAFTFHYLSMSIWFLVSFTLGLEGWKVVELVIRNAARRQSAYAKLLAADSLARPAGSILLAWIFGSSIESLLAGQAMGMFLVLAGFALFSVKSKRADYTPGISKHGDIEPFKRNMSQFAKPLLLTPIVGWMSGLADRYIVGGILGIAQAGIYAAAYGIASRPFLLLSSITEATLRQHFYEAFSNSDSYAVKKIFAIWIVLNVLLGFSGAFLILWLREPITHLLLAREYYDAANLLAWIAIGYVFLVTSHAIERIIYAAGNTRVVVAIQFVSAIVGILLAYIGAKTMGLEGVALAVPVYFGLQLLITFLNAKRVVTKSNNSILLTSVRRAYEDIDR